MFKTSTLAFATLAATGLATETEADQVLQKCDIKEEHNSYDDHRDYDDHHDRHASHGFPDKIAFAFKDKVSPAYDFVRDHSPSYHGISSYGHGSYSSHKGQVRGPVRQPRRREDPMEIDDSVLKGEKDAHKGKFRDWRDYDPNLHPYDYYSECKFPEETKHLDTEEYQRMSAKCKEELVWQKTLSDGRRERFYTGPEFNSLFNQDMNHSYDSVTDTMPEGRKKVTHPVGCTGKVEFIAHPDSPYTGMFRGAKHGIARISETVKTTPEVTKTVPGHGVKLFRDGMSSANWVAMFSFDGHESFNFFKNRWTTILRESNNQCARETIMKHLATVTDHVGATSVMEVAMFDQYGNEEEYPHWPYQLDIEHYDVFGWTDEYQNDFQDQMAMIPMDTVLHKVIAYDEPPELGGEEILAGWLVTRSDQVSSLWADRELFFQHRRMDDDIKHRPHYFEWLQFWDNGKHTETPLANPAPQQRCPFFFLFEQAGLA